MVWEESVMQNSLLGVGMLSVAWIVVAQPVQAEETLTDGRIAPILQLSDLEQPATTLDQGLADQGLAQVRTQITSVQLNPTEAGLEVVLQTPNGTLSMPTFSTVGNALIAEIPNAVLSLADGELFEAFSPTDTLATVTVANLSGDRVRVTLTGTAAPPIATSRAEMGQLILGVTPGDGNTTTASSTPDTPLQIVVTAEKTPEEAQDVPISLTVLTEQDLEDADVTSLEAIAGSTPNFTVFSAGGNRNTTFYSIRGLSNSNFASRDAVSFYVDDVPYDFSNFLNLDLVDLERVEILRGPQNTLYGRSAQAGVVNIITRRPTNAFEVNGAIDYGSYADLETQASVSGPLVSDRLFYRLSGGYNRRDGYVENTFLDEDTGDQSGGTGRGQLLWTPSANWEIALSGSFDDYRDGAFPLVPLGQPFEVAQDYEGFNDLTTDSQSLRIAYSNDDIRATSITSRRYSRQNAAVDIDGTRLDGGRVTNEFASTVWSQEFRIQSPQAADQWQWIVGGYFENSTFNSDNDGLNFGTDAPQLFGNLGVPGSSLLRQAEAEQTTAAAFGQVSYLLTDTLTLTAGLRYETNNSTLESLERVFTLPDGTTQTLATFNDIEQDSSAWLPRVVLEYRPTDNLMLYSSIARGYKPGGVNFRADDDITLTFEAENSWNFEVGARSSWLENRLSLNAAVFFNPVNDYQVISVNELDVPIEVTNAGVNLAGFELEARATPLDGLDIIAGIGFVDAEFTDFTNRSGQSFDGNRPPYVPDFTYNLAVQYRSPIGLFGRLELQGLGTTYFDEANDFQQDPVAVVNARIGYEFENYGIYLLANNLFDTEYLTNVLGNRATYGVPVTYAIQVRARF